MRLSSRFGFFAFGRASQCLVVLFWEIQIEEYILTNEIQVWDSSGNWGKSDLAI
jgi:hypothetical protein